MPYLIICKLSGNVGDMSSLVESDSGNDGGDDCDLQ
jgi:hypothetical protein